MNEDEKYRRIKKKEKKRIKIGNINSENVKISNKKMTKSKRQFLRCIFGEVT